MRDKLDVIWEKAPPQESPMTTINYEDSLEGGESLGGDENRIST
jgi:hypothetical protein